MEEAVLIKSYKADFLAKTGKCLKIKICSRWESVCELPCKLELDTVLNIIFDATGWSYEEVFTNDRKAVSLFRRGLIYFILVHNEFSLLKLARRTDKEHTSIMNARKKFEQLLETEPLTSKILLEVMDYIHTNYQYYH